MWYLKVTGDEKGGVGRCLHMGEDKEAQRVQWGRGQGQGWAGRNTEATTPIRLSRCRHISKEHTFNVTP